MHQQHQATDKEKRQHQPDSQQVQRLELGGVFLEIVTAAYTEEAPQHGLDRGEQATRVLGGRVQEAPPSRGAGTAAVGEDGADTAAVGEDGADTAAVGEDGAGTAAVGEDGAGGVLPPTSKKV